MSQTIIPSRELKTLLEGIRKRSNVSELMLGSVSSNAELLDTLDLLGGALLGFYEDVREMQQRLLDAGFVPGAPPKAPVKRQERAQ